MKRALFAGALAASLVATSLLTFVAAPTVTGVAWAQGSPLAQAQSLYDSAKFADAVALLRTAISSGQVNGPEALKAKELLGRCLVKSGDRIGGKEAFKSLLREDSGYRIDTVNVPPDEVEVFNLAAKEITAEQIEAGRRIPASLAGVIGWDLGGSSDVKDLLDAHGKQDLKNSAEFGGSVRFPIKPRWSLDVAIMHYNSKALVIYDFGGSPDSLNLRTQALSIVGSVVYTAIAGNKWRTHFFVGGGPLTGAELQLIPLQSSGIRLIDGRTGIVLQGGVEEEYLFHSKLALLATATGRRASSGGLNYGPFFGSSTDFDLNGRAVDYSGVALTLALRAYIGY